MPHPGNDKLIERLLEGKTYSEMAEEFQCGIGSIHRWLMDPQIVEESARAREHSAEAWLDRGLSAITDALRKDSMYDSGAARAYAQECARRAAIRNPRYRESQNHKVSGDPESPLKTSMEITFK